MLPFGVTIPANVPQGSQIPEGLTNNPVLRKYSSQNLAAVSHVTWKDSVDSSTCVRRQEVAGIK